MMLEALMRLEVEMRLVLHRIDGLIKEQDQAVMESLAVLDPRFAVRLRDAHDATLNTIRVLREHVRTRGDGRAQASPAVI